MTSIIIISASAVAIYKLYRKLRPDLLSPKNLEDHQKSIAVCLYDPTSHPTLQLSDHPTHLDLSTMAKNIVSTNKFFSCHIQTTLPAKLLSNEVKRLDEKLRIIIVEEHLMPKKKFVKAMKLLAAVLTYSKDQPTVIIVEKPESNFHLSNKSMNKRVLKQFLELYDQISSSDAQIYLIWRSETHLHDLQDWLKERIHERIVDEPYSRWGSF